MWAAALQASHPLLSVSRPLLPAIHARTDGTYKKASSKGVLETKLTTAISQGRFLPDWDHSSNLET